MENNRLLQEVNRLRNQTPMQDAEYHFITLLGTEDGRIKRSVSSTWAGFTDTRPRREIREAVLVIPNKLMDLLNSINEPGAIVNDRKDLFLYLLIGGHGIIEKSLAQKYFRDLIYPREVIQSFARGWIYSDDLPKQNTQHAPTRKLRIAVLKRDNYRCKVCGRTPSDYVDVELDVHHILPWGQGGITDQDNLITLCSTCHDGLDPHYEMQLFNLINISMLQDVMIDSDDYREGVMLYRKVSVKAVRRNQGK
jgi:rubredoxin